MALARMFFNPANLVGGNFNPGAFVGRSVAVRGFYSGESDVNDDRDTFC